MDNRDYRIKMLEKAISFEVKKLYKSSIEETYQKAKVSEKTIIKNKKQLKVLAEINRELEKNFKPSLISADKETSLINQTTSSLAELKTLLENELIQAEEAYKKKDYLPPLYLKSNLFGASLLLYGFIGDDSEAEWINDLVDESPEKNVRKLKRIIGDSVKIHTSLDQFHRKLKDKESTKRFMQLTGNLMPAFDSRKKLVGYRRDELKRTLLNGAKIRFKNVGVLDIVSGLIIYPQWFNLVENIVSLKFASPQIETDDGILIELGEDSNSLFFSFSQNGRSHKEFIIENFEEAFNYYFK